MLTEEQLKKFGQDAYDLKETALKQWPAESLETHCADHITALVAEVRRLRAENDDLRANLDLASEPELMASLYATLLPFTPASAVHADADGFVTPPAVSGEPKTYAEHLGRRGGVPLADEPDAPHVVTEVG